MPAEDDITDSLEALRLTHEQAIDMLVPNVSEGEDDDEYDYDYDYDQEMGDGGGGGDYDWLDDKASALSGAGSVLSHASSLPVGASALSTPPSSVVVTQGQLGQQQQQQQQGQSQGGEAAGKAKSRTLASLRLQPQFNLDSAGKLLETFRKVMLSHFHCKLHNLRFFFSFRALGWLPVATGSCRDRGSTPKAAPMPRFGKK
jgi:hypothetical protein